MCIRKYMEDYPTDIRLPKLKKNLDQVLWNRAKVSDNVDGYAEYLLLMPDGLHAREAEQKVEILDKAVLTAGAKFMFSSGAVLYPYDTVNKEWCYLNFFEHPYYLHAREFVSKPAHRL